MASLPIYATLSVTMNLLWFTLEWGILDWLPTGTIKTFWKKSAGLKYIHTALKRCEFVFHFDPSRFHTGDAPLFKATTNWEIWGKYERESNILGVPLQC